MKVLNYKLAIILGLVSLSSCSNNDDEVIVNSDVKVEKTFSVGMPTNSATRAFMYGFDTNRASQEIHWDQSDKITIIANGQSKGDPFEIKSITSPANKATFKGFTYDANEYWALYPAQDDARLTSEGYLQFTIPNEQIATPNTFDPAAGVQIGHIVTQTAGGFQLKNVCAFFVIELEEDCEYVTIESLNSPEWWLAGTVVAEARSGSAAIKGFVAGKCQSKIELKNIPSEGGIFFIPFIPSDQHPGVKLTVKFKNDSMPVPYEFNPKSGNKISFSAGFIYDMGKFGALHIPAPPFVDGSDAE